ncbi:hypothetical protein K5X77_08970 [Vagococcus lutrae]|uniref:AbiTii domain-containing protein n=1 Tax=Vagococcus lutrae TaxID=81947 RepID=UPI001C966FCE|nr:hypothetical protein [Vagococcus lutrae]MDT2806615.1 hypothetical protein [Vagococcus lutrae]MDT2817242.1 hypothetical protein [Vagococcus lutrae]MDT2824036.1 hypothetical protein [Vagococcus lutrae]QZN88564.1 hypothetical protein K5X77_08970 [Vagococcus lutrae]UQF12539.1 hypothetical protein M2919_04260 [Vagococcus lutrae]
MGKIVLDLQQEALSKDSDVLNLLRKAYIVARKLKLNEFEEWVNNELNGYQETDKIPDYRKVRGEVKAWNPYLGWIPMIIQNNEIANQLSEHLASDSIPNLKNVYESLNGNHATLQFDAGMNNLLSKSSGVNTKYALMISANQIYNIMERVRNIVLDWSITLEENDILGEGLQFTEKEKDIAVSSSTINNYTNNFYGDVQETQIQQNTSESTQK